MQLPLAAAVLLVAALQCVAAFTDTWHEERSVHFDVLKSSTLEMFPTDSFVLHYADTTELRGFHCKDHVKFGRVTGDLSFACLYHCNSPDFNDSDGILGFGRVVNDDRLPSPLFTSLTDPNNLLPGSPQLSPKFSFLSTPKEAELQIGGYDPSSIVGDMVFIETIRPQDYTVRVSSLKFGSSLDDAQELLQFSQPTVQSLAGIVDSGTSCLVFPGHNVHGYLKDNPFALFSAASSKLSSTNPVGSFWITIEGHQFEIPKSAWWLDQTQEACIESSPAGMNGLLIGDVFFREYLVQFDVSAPDKTVVGIGKLRHDYHPVKKLEQRRVVNVDASSQSLAQTLHVMPAFKKSGRTLTQRPVTRLAALQSPVTGLSSDVLLDEMPVFNRHGTQYFVKVSIGQPLQHFTVIFDTGSAVFGVFIRSADLPKDISFSRMRFARTDVSTLSAVGVQQQQHPTVQARPAAAVAEADAAEPSPADAHAPQSRAQRLAVSTTSSSEPSWLTWTDVGIALTIINVAIIVSVVKVFKARGSDAAKGSLSDI